MDEPALRSKKGGANWLRTLLWSDFPPFFSFTPWKMLKKHILTRIWSAQHPNAGQNIQQLTNAYDTYSSLFTESVRHLLGQHLQK